MENFKPPFDLEKLVAEISERTAAMLSERIVTPRWLKLAAAKQYSSYSRTTLLKLAKENLIVGFQDPNSKRGDWKFDKQSIDEYMISQVVGERHKALSILGSLKAS
ncbi:hypothetical protein [Desulfospira joergensenii]|uniref:hypothetical protein n=1 Tax=Desulfospira joergensenii TaxID=53329 RepID=UPI0003B6DBFC|nr:hypothetical protein [Desulfospira joergensenii]